MLKKESLHIDLKYIDVNYHDCEYFYIIPQIKITIEIVKF
jgi:hypothetical protein